ncbi:hypothetical protein SAMN02982929_05248 [Saccharopolyspora kobensis]|uniref:Uncharacterized protein n=2 Tax=Saccharopolyspora kobensis TaxID=146035 RepID=A0A1H6DZY8_9PSEU|nr:hypothetical protein SAMN02982929_05248 [Saccharopolyspora kobensis]SFD91869.1 hypothetical protein SAMN05216506_107223 [Saccharopolyspora kobensis]
MNGTPELDQVAAARRQLATHAQYPAAYWAAYGVVLVLLAGLPIWNTWLRPGSGPYISSALTVLAMGSAIYASVRRRRTGVHLRKRITAYPSAWPIWLVGIAIALIGLFGLQALVSSGQREIALLALPVVALAVFLIQFKTRSAMRRDIEEGRVRS